MDMDTTCRQWITDILKDHLSLVALAVRQRAKFEGWLKFELAQRAEAAGCIPVRVESAYGEGRSDITFHANGMRYDMELKTPNTSWRMPGVENATRPITMNIESIVQDALKLRNCPGQGVVSFVLFPVPSGSRQWRTYLDRIAHALETSLSEDQHCTRVHIPINKDQACDVVVQGL